MDDEGSQNTRSRFQVTYRRSVARKLTLIAVLAVIILITVIFSLTIGTYKISFTQVYEIVWDYIIADPYANKTMTHIVIDLRFPRILAAAVCGFGLAVCGAAMQSMLKNPMADPYTMGISSGAGFGASLAILMGVEAVSNGGVVANAFIFACAPALVVLFLSQFRKATPTMMILCGIALMYLFSSATQLFMLVSDPDDLAETYRWTVGSLDSVDYSELLLIFIITVIGTLFIQAMAKNLNAMGLGDENAQILGINVSRRRLMTLLVVTLVAASIVSFTGIIGFVGLVGPHIARFLVGSDNKYLIPASGLLGSLLLLISDIISKTIVAPVILPVGVVMSCIGGPLFLFLVLRSHKEVWS